MIIDSHCHLNYDPLINSIPEIIKRAEAKVSPSKPEYFFPLNLKDIFLFLFIKPKLSNLKFWLIIYISLSASTVLKISCVTVSL